MEKTRICPGCEEEKPLDRRHFYRNASLRSGYHTRCKGCCNESHRRSRGKALKEVRLTPKILAQAKKGNLKAIAVLKLLNVTAIWNGREMVQL